MSRSGYSDDHEQWQVNLWRSAVTRSLRGKRGQVFLKEMLAAFDAMPDKRLIAHDLETRTGEVCALGSVGRARGMEMLDIDPEDHEGVASQFDLPHALACEIMFMNDEGHYAHETPEQRFARMRAWVERQIKQEG